MMAQVRPTFDFDLNELPPPEEDCAKGVPPGTDPAREPSAQDPPLSERESSLLDPLPPPSSAPQDLSLPSSPPVLDLEAPLSPLVEDEDGDADLELPGPPSPAPEPEPRASVIPVAPSRSMGDGAADDYALGTTRLLCRPGRHGGRTSSPMASLPDGETERPSAPRAPSRGPSGETTTSSHKSRDRPPPYYAPHDDAISKRRRRRGGNYDDEDAASSHGGSGRAGRPSPRRYEQEASLAPAMSDEQRPMNRRRRLPQRPYDASQRTQQGYRGRYREQKQPGHANQDYGHDQRTQQGYRGGDREQPAQENQNYSHDQRTQQGYRGRENQGREPAKTVAYHQHKEDVPFSGARGRDYGRRHSSAQEPARNGEYHHHREAPSFRSPRSGAAHGREGRQNLAAAQVPSPNANGGYNQQTEAPRRRGHAPFRPYHHPYAHDAGALDDQTNSGKQARHESRRSYYQQPRAGRRHDKQDWRK